jgi:hypothetical protein
MVASVVLSPIKKFLAEVVHIFQKFEGVKGQLLKFCGPSPKLMTKKEHENASVTF